MELALYLHVPFCRRRCTYCDFVTYADRGRLQPRYAAALQQDLRGQAERLRADVPEARAVTLYFGGGTPSLLPAEAIAALIEEAHRSLSLPAEAEITLEANPGTVDAAYLAALRRAGVNRLSLGIQSADAGELEMLGRIHTWEDAIHTVSAARQAGFDNLSLDLIFGLPGQSLSRWQASLAATLELLPEHISLYALTLEAGTPLAEAVAHGQLPEPNVDLAADCYEWTSQALRDAGFWQYEISNWARGLETAPEVWSLPPTGLTEGIGPWISHHNLHYWRNATWLGVGVAAHSFMGRRRWSNLTDPEAYIAAVEAGAPTVAESEEVTRVQEIGETMMLGLRLAEGVRDSDFRARFGVGLVEMFEETIEAYWQHGLIEWDDTRIRLSTRGRLLGNQVFVAFL